MPTVAVINGINVEFYFDEHPPPHFHARYAEFVAQMNIETKLAKTAVADNPGMGHSSTRGSTSSLERLSS